VAGLDADSFEELPNEFCTVGSVVIQCLVRPFSGNENASSGDT
jgi:hypothetical protein